MRWRVELRRSRRGSSDGHRGDEEGSEREETGAKVQHDELNPSWGGQVGQILVRGSTPTTYASVVSGWARMDFTS